MATIAQGKSNVGGSGVFSAGTQSEFKKQLNKVYIWYTGGFILFVATLAVLEQFGLPRTGSASSSCSPPSASMPASAS